MHLIWNTIRDEFLRDIQGSFFIFFVYLLHNRIVWSQNKIYTRKFNKVSTRHDIQFTPTKWTCSKGRLFLREVLPGDPMRGRRLDRWPVHVTAPLDLPESGPVLFVRPHRTDGVHRLQSALLRSTHIILLVTEWRRRDKSFCGGSPFLAPGLSSGNVTLT